MRAVQSVRVQFMCFWVKNNKIRFMAIIKHFFLHAFGLSVPHKSEILEEHSVRIEKLYIFIITVLFLFKNETKKLCTL